MKKSLLALAAVATLAISVASPAHAENGWVPGVAAGIIGGAIVGGAIASSPYGPGYYGPATTIPAITTRAMAARATGGVSASGTVTAGRCAAFASANDPSSFAKISRVTSDPGTSHPLVGAFHADC
jgi:hypothetical protein